MITDQQVVLLRQKLMEGKTQQAAAAASATSERSVRRWQRGALPSERRRNRRGWRTRPDPFVDVWERDVEPLLRSDPEGELSATTILEWLDERHPGRFGSSHLRTLQRRIRDYRALHGPDREVYFQQDHPPMCQRGLLVCGGRPPGRNAGRQLVPAAGRGTATVMPSPVPAP